MSKEMKLITKGNLYALQWEGGGEMPKALLGYYTSQKEAENARDAYLATRKPRRSASGSRKSGT